MRSGLQMSFTFTTLARRARRSGHLLEVRAAWQKRAGTPALTSRAAIRCLSASLNSRKKCRNATATTATMTGATSENGRARTRSDNKRRVLPASGNTFRRRNRARRSRQNAPDFRSVAAARRISSPKPRPLGGAKALADWSRATRQHRHLQRKARWHRRPPKLPQRRRLSSVARRYSSSSSRLEAKLQPLRRMAARA